MPNSPRNPQDLSLGLLHRIIVEAASAHSFEEQVHLLVTQVRAALAVDVCSLYQLESEGLLTMVSNVGLAEDVTRRIVLKVGEGLVGQIAESKLPLNVPIAHLHPDYRYFPQSTEEKFQAFLGVPILNLGHVIGVLVVQDGDEGGFTADEESFLITIAAQLAGSMLRLPRPSAVEVSSDVERKIDGLHGAPGKTIGNIRFVIDEKTLALVDGPAFQGVDVELEYLTKAIESAQADMRDAKQRFAALLTDEVLALFDFYSELLASDQLINGAQRRIHEGSSAFNAVRATVDEHVKAFEAIENEYLRARAEDVRHVGQKLLSGLLGQTSLNLESENLVLLGDAVGVADIAQYERQQVAGIICLNGSSYSHTTLLAKALAIPVVIGTGPIDLIKEGDLVVVDGDEGFVLLNPNELTRSSYATTIADTQRLDEALLSQRDLPAITCDGTRIQLLANTGLLSDITPGKLRGAEGVGLYRTEIPFMQHSAFPTEAEQYAIYHDVLAAYAPLPVTMRTLDIGADKQLPYLTLNEENPALGWRGIRFSLGNRAIFVLQLRAMLRANAVFGNLKIMVPMVSALAEVIDSAQLLDDVIAQLGSEGVVVPRPPLGIMVEVPGIVPILHRVAQWIDFISVGTNDLTQYLLAVDRVNPHVAASYDFFHPAVLHTLAEIAGHANAHQLDLSICGEMAADPHGSVILIGMGYRTLSMNAYSLPHIKALIRRLNLDDAQAMAASALLNAEAEETRASVMHSFEELSLAEQVPSVVH